MSTSSPTQKPLPLPPRPLPAPKIPQRPASIPGNPPLALTAADVLPLNMLTRLHLQALKAREARRIAKEKAEAATAAAIAASPDPVFNTTDKRKASGNGNGNGNGHRTVSGKRKYSGGGETGGVVGRAITDKNGKPAPWGLGTGVFDFPQPQPLVFSTFASTSASTSRASSGGEYGKVVGGVATGAVLEGKWKEWEDKDMAMGPEDAENPRGVFRL